MKTYFFALLLIIIGGLLTYAMSSVPPTPPPFKSAEVTGPLHRAPLFLADSSSFTFFLNISSSSPSSIDGRITVEGTSEENLNGKNLSWRISNTLVNTGFDIRLWGIVSFFAKFSYSSEILSGGDIGIGLTLPTAKMIRTRFDVGLYKQKMTSKADGFGNSYIDPDPFISLVLNSSFENFPLEPFLQTSYSRHTLFTFHGFSKAVTSHINLLTFTPGVNYPLSDIFSLMIGADFFIPSALKNRSSAILFSGFAQCNLLF